MVFQHNQQQGQLVDWYRSAGIVCIVINPAGYSFTSVSLLDTGKRPSFPSSKSISTFIGGSRFTTSAGLPGGAGHLWAGTLDTIWQSRPRRTLQIRA